MNCPKCGWPGLIGGSLKRELASAQEGNRLRMEDNAALRGEVERLRALLVKVVEEFSTQGLKSVARWVDKQIVPEDSP